MSGLRHGKQLATLLTAAQQALPALSCGLAPGTLFFALGAAPEPNGCTLANRGRSHPAHVGGTCTARSWSATAAFHAIPTPRQQSALALVDSDDDELPDQPAATGGAAEGRRTASSATDASTSAPAQPASCPDFDAALSAERGPIVSYAKGRLAGLYRYDPRQENTIVLLQRLYEQLEERFVRRRLPSGLTMVDTVEPSASQPPRWWGRLTNLVGGGARSSVLSTPRGLYMYGGVGCGKTMLMDLLVATAPAEFKLRRTHFHDFMLDVHARLRLHASESDPLAQVGNDISRETKVLCLDELFVTDVADAMILHRLFGRLWATGLVLVATSNRAPEKLYEGGLQRDLFMPFIDRLQASCVVHNMESGVDYRKLAQHKRGLYFVTPDRDELLYERFVELTNNRPIGPRRIPVAMGRTLDLSRTGGCIALCDFPELCSRPLGAADYIALANAEHTVALAGVPRFTAELRAEAYRFVTLVDVLYEHRTRVLISAEALPHELFEHVVSNAEARATPDSALREELVVDDALAFAKDRTVSRLTEMQSAEYLRAHARLHATELLLALAEDKEAQRQAGGGRELGDGNVCA